jgi:hypothetical protein
MGNNTSVPEPEKVKFGTVYGTDGKTRPGYYLGNGKVIYKGQEIPTTPGETDFQKLKFGYLKSNKHVYYNGKIIPGANPATFLTIERKNAKTLSKLPEKNKEFEKLNSVLGMDYVGNKKRIYFGDHVIHQEN